MRKIILYSVFCILYSVAFTSCTQQPKQVVAVTTEAIPVNANADGIQDVTYLAQLAPVKEDLEREMNVQIGYTPERMWVDEPECPMLNWASDALWEAAKKAYPGKVDIAIAKIPRL